MVQLDVTETEVKILQEFVESALSNLSYEIADTDLQTYRDELKIKREALKKLERALASS